VFRHWGKEDLDKKHRSGGAVPRAMVALSGAAPTFPTRACNSDFPAGKMGLGRSEFMGGKPARGGRLRASRAVPGGPARRWTFWRGGQDSGPRGEFRGNGNVCKWGYRERTRAHRWGPPPHRDWANRSYYLKKKYRYKIENIKIVFSIVLLILAYGWGGEAFREKKNRKAMGTGSRAGGFGGRQFTPQKNPKGNYESSISAGGHVIQGEDRVHHARGGGKRIWRISPPPPPPRKKVLREPDTIVGGTGKPPGRGRGTFFGN